MPEATIRLLRAAQPDRRTSLSSACLRHLGPDGKPFRCAGGTPGTPEPPGTTLGMDHFAESATTTQASVHLNKPVRASSTIRNTQRLTPGPA